MRTGIKFALLLLIFLFSHQVKADEAITAEIYFNRAGMKILSGVANVTTGWMELPKNIMLWHRKAENPLTGFAEGMLRGIVHVASRTANGALDLATFWLPTFPSPEPAFIWDDFSQESEYHGFRIGR